VFCQRRLAETIARLNKFLHKAQYSTEIKNRRPKSKRFKLDRVVAVVPLGFTSSDLELPGLSDDVGSIDYVAANSTMKSIGKLPALISESKTDRFFFAALAFILIAGFFFTTHQYWIPASPGTDQNGYLVGGKYFAWTFSTGFKPQSPYEFVGHEWIEARGKYFPKYPLGLSVLYAIMLKIGGAKFGVPAAFMVNPIAMTLALVAIFSLARIIVGSFFALLATLLVMTSPVCIGLTNTPNSHATAICCVAWGFYLLFRWWQRNGYLRAIGAGLLIGSAVTIRYTEGMLILPIVIVVFFNFRSWKQSLALLASWALPVAILAAYNWFSMHHLTGYDTTNESTGFTFDKFQDNWEIMLRELYNTGLFFTLPLALFGVFVLFKWNWRIASLLAAWAVPNLLLYTSYYWAPDGPNIGYLRFVLTVFPVLAIASVFAVKWITEQVKESRVLCTVALSLLIAIGCGVNLNTALASSETESLQNRNLLQGTQTVMKNIPAGSLIFGVDQQLNYLQLVADYHLCDLTQFDPRQVSQYAMIDPTIATAGLQPQRAMEIYDRVKGLSEYEMGKELVRQQNQVMTDAFANGQRVFFVLPTNRRNEINRLLPKKAFLSNIITTWEEPGDLKGPAKPHWLGITKANAQNEVKKAAIWQIVEVTPAPPPKPKPIKVKVPTTKPAMKKSSPMNR
jgi:hypothetical protein